MSERDDDRFRPRVGRLRARGTGASSRFVNRVLKAATKAGPLGRASTLDASPPHGAKFGRGVVAARLAAARQGPRSRRVTVKIRLVKVGVSGRPALQAHLRYIERAGVSPEGARGQAYAAATNSADTDAFADRCVGDRHQFRCIVAPEEATALGDLKTYTRGLLGRVEQDLATRLDWVAVDHWDTDNPHTHVVIRGKDQAGRDLIIARDYISHGMRARASELATEWLGPRSDREIRAGLDREVTADRWTGLDRTLQGLATDGRVDLRRIAGETPDPVRRYLLVGRLQRLIALKVARQTEPGAWRLEPHAEQTLRALGERGDIVRTMQRAVGQGRTTYAVFDPATATQAVTGRIAARGLADEHHDHPYLIVDGVDGRAHYVRLPGTLDGNELPLGGIVSVRVRTGVRAADRAVAVLARDGIYRPVEHLALASANRRSGQDPAEFVAAHVRRLEALRRAGIGERLADGNWRVPPDLAVQGARFDQRGGGRVAVALESALPVERQVRVIGATWLDRELIDGRGGFAVGGFGGEVRQALAARADFLVQQQLAERRGPRLLVPRDLLTTLRERELAGVAATVATQTGRSYRPLRDGGKASGIYRQRLQLASGQFAVLDDGQGFSLVPWRPVLVFRVGQSVSAVVRGDHVSWHVGGSPNLSR